MSRAPSVTMDSRAGISVRWILPEPDAPAPLSAGYHVECCLWS